MPSSASSPVTRQPVLTLQAAVAFFLLLKLAYFVLLPPIGDEAYYWLWGQRLALSYFDHPPLHAWLLGLMGRLFGWNIFSLRILTWASLAGTAWIFWLWSKRISPEHPKPWFLAALAIYLGSPLLFVMGSISFHDHLLIVLSLASGHFFLTFAEQWYGGNRGFSRLYIAAVFLGLAVLTKYNGLFLGLGYCVFILAHPSFRPLLRHRQTYAAGAIAIALQAPVIYWNLANGFASLRFHAVERWDGVFQLDLPRLVETAEFSLLTLSIFLLIPMVRLFRPGGGDFERLARSLASIILALSTVTIGLIGAFEYVAAYWNIMAYPLAMPLMVQTMRTRVIFWLHLLVGALLSMAFLVDFAIVPIPTLFNSGSFTEYTNYDWDRVAAIVRAAHAQEPQSFLAATRYTTAAQLAFAIHDVDVTDLSSRPTEFNYWFDPASHVGQNALILAAPFIPITPVSGKFRRVTLLQNIDVERFGHQLGSYQLYRAEGFCGGPCGPANAP